MSVDVQIILAAGAALLLHEYLSVRFSLFFQPLRLELVAMVEDIAGDQATPRAVVVTLNRMLDDAYSVRAAWMICGLFLPYAIAAKVWSDEEPSHAALPVHLQRKMAGAYRAGLICALANSLLAFALFAVQLVIAVGFWLPAARGLRRLMARVAARGVPASETYTEAV